MDTQIAEPAYRERATMTQFDLTSGARSEVFTFAGPRGCAQAAIEVAADGLFIFVESLPSEAEGASSFLWRR